MSEIPVVDDHARQRGIGDTVELRRDFPHVAVVAMSGHDHLKLMLRAAKGLGAIRTIRKPFEPDALLALVAEELDWVRASAEARNRVPESGMGK